MKKNLIIKLNDVIADISPVHNQAIKKSIEFFLGRMMDMKEIAEFRKKTCSSTSKECIMKFLNENGLFLREAAIEKKFNEYYLGKEYGGLINNCCLLIDKNKLKKISAAHNVIILSLMPKNEAEFIAKNLGISGILNIIHSESAKEGINKAREKINGAVSYVGNTLADYTAAIESNIEFLGLNIDKNIIEKGKAINDIEELI